MRESKAQYASAIIGYVEVLIKNGPESEEAKEICARYEKMGWFLSIIEAINKLHRTVNAQVEKQETERKVVKLKKARGKSKDPLCPGCEKNPEGEVKECLRTQSIGKMETVREVCSCCEACRKACFATFLGRD